MCSHDHTHDHKHCHSHEHNENHCHHSADTCCCSHEHEHNYEHEHSSCSCGCNCGHEHGKEPTRGELTKLLLGAVLFAAGVLLMHSPLPAWAGIIVLAAAYLWLGGEVLLTAGKNILRGHIFDENFLMSIATLGAFAIQEYPEAVGVMLFYRVGEYFENRAVAQSRRQITEAVDMRPDVVNRLPSTNPHATPEEIPAADAMTGDLLLVRPGDRVPLDSVIIEGESRLDTSALTGEALPVGVKVGDEILSGCLNINAPLVVRVQKPLAESTVTRILQSVENAAETKPRIDRFITRFARVYTPIVVVLALGVATLPPLILQSDFIYWLKTALTFLVISCPCALVLSVPLAYFSGIGAASRHGILFKSGLAMEAISRIKAVAFDKTGTLTHGNFAVQSILPANGVSADEVLYLAATAESAGTHPIAASIITAAKTANISFQRPNSIEEIAGMGVHAVIDDKTVLCGNQKLLQKFGVDLGNFQPTLGVTEVLVARDGTFCGQIEIADSVKADAPQAVAQVKRQGLRVCILTGDSEHTAKAVAQAVGVDEVHSRLLPQDKLAVLGDIRQRLGGVMFVGDGINDAPTLAGADIGAAMGSGSDTAIEAADVVFIHSNTNAVPKAIDIARAANRIALQNIVFALGVKAAIMLVGLGGHANMWLAVFADTGVAMLCLLNSIRILYRK